MLRLVVYLLQDEGKQTCSLTVQLGQNRTGFIQKLSLRSQDVIALCPCLQPALVDPAGGVAELDSDMADITQSLPAESIMGAEEDDELPAADVDVSEHDGTSASSQIASSLGINPHTLQVEPPPTQEVTSVKTFKMSGDLNQTEPGSTAEGSVWVWVFQWIIST